VTAEQIRNSVDSMSHLGSPDIIGKARLRIEVEIAAQLAELNERMERVIVKLERIEQK
jgi:hypothetical protein